MRKTSVSLSGHQTSISLEQEFFDVLQNIAHAQKTSVASIIKHIDEHKNVLPYSSRIVDIKTSGPIELVGPTQQCLLGGQLTIYVKSKNENGPASISLTVDNVTKKIDLEVKSR